MARFTARVLEDEIAQDRLEREPALPVAAQRGGGEIRARRWPAVSRVRRWRGSPPRSGRTATRNPGRSMSSSGHAPAERLLLRRVERLFRERQYQRRLSPHVSALQPGESGDVGRRENRLLAPRKGVEALPNARPLQVHRRMVGLDLVDHGRDLGTAAFGRLLAQQREKMLLLVALMLQSRGLEEAQYDARRFARLV